MIITEIHKRYYAVPTEWNELTGKQLVQVMYVLYGGFEVTEATLRLLKIIAGMSWWQWCRTSVEEKADFLYLTHFLINENTLTKQLLPEYSGLYGPDDDFNNITGEEFVFSEDFYFKAFKVEEEEGGGRIMLAHGLDNLCAVLYRTKKNRYDVVINKDGDAREPFNQNIATYFADKVVSKWPIAVKLAIFTWYEVCRKQLIDSNPEIFTGGSGEPAKYGLLSVMRVIAEGGIHGDFEKVQKMYVKMWMIELNERYEEAKRNEKSVSHE